MTQNIDGLHQKAGSSPDRVIEIHGTVREVVCMACGERAPMERALDRVRAGEADPPCRSCEGILKSATISFGQSLVAEDLIRAEKAAQDCDVFLALGTMLTVYPVAYLPHGPSSQRSPGDRQRPADALRRAGRRRAARQPGRPSPPPGGPGLTVPDRECNGRRSRWS